MASGGQPQPAGDVNPQNAVRLRAYLERRVTAPIGAPAVDKIRR